ncbi:winged helix-turn-helix transcriptional regulator [Marinicellulosiphila megalodicopiae]|uniref:winged helix-turn-helix transcriptional regulator n=1 Tax=Marinicellulosiphila megalodicopiae TaxID=2724896 RepID=UPI003BB0A5EF
MKQNPYLDLSKPCPVAASLNLINRKWSPMLMHCLSQSTQQFGEILRVLSPISKKVLTDELKRLVDAKLVMRKQCHNTVVTVEYSLSDKGKSLLPILESLTHWGLDNIEHNQLDLTYINKLNSG